MLLSYLTQCWRCSAGHLQNIIEITKLLAVALNLPRLCGGVLLHSGAMAHSGAPCGGSELDGSPEFLNFLATLPDMSCNVEEEVENLSTRTLMNEFRAEEGKGVHSYSDSDLSPYHRGIHISVY